MTEGFAAGMPVTTVLAQQLNHLSYAMSGPQGLSGAFKGALGAFAGLISPTALVVGGIAAVAVGAYFAVTSMTTMGKAFDDAAHSADTTTGVLHELATAAAFKGIASADFLKAMDQFAHGVYQAKNDMGGLADVFRANNVHASSFDDYLAKAADLIKNCSTDQQRLVLLQQMGLPATMDWVRFLSQGADGIKRAQEEAVKFNASAEGQLVAAARKFDEAWNTSWANWTNNLKNALLKLDEFSFSAIDKFKALAKNSYGGASTAAAGQGLISGAAGFKGNSGYTPDPFGTSAKPTVDIEALKKTIQDEQTRIGILGQTASIEDTVRGVELQIQRARLDGVSISSKEEASLKRLAEERALGITQMKDSTRSLRLEADTAGMSVAEQQTYLATQIALNGARRDGKPLTAENIARIREEADALGQAAQHADNMKWSYTNLVNGPMQAFTSAIAQGATAMDALKKAGQSALNSIASKLADMASQNLWKAAFGGSSGGAGIFGSLFGSAGSGAAQGSISVGAQSFPAFGFHSGAGPGDSPTFTRYVSPAHFNDAPRFHTGIGPGETAAIIRNDESVLTPGQMKQLSPAAAQPVIINQYNTFTGNDPGTEARMRQAIAQSKDQAVSEAVQAVARVRGTSPSYLAGQR